MICAHGRSKHMNSKIITTKPGKEMREADEQIQNTRFHQDANKELELL